MHRTGPANLSQIAQELGLSVTTVSRALKDGPEVHPDTRARVKAVAARVGYVPNLAGRALRTGQTRNLTAILPLETRDYLSDLAKLPLIEGMTLAAQDRGYALAIASTTPEEDPLSGLMRVLRSGATDGVIITRIVAADPRLPFLMERRFPFVAFGRSDLDLDHASVDVENEAIVEDASRRLIAEGCRRIALQLLVPHDHVSAMRLVGYRGAMEAAGLSVDPALIGEGAYTIEASEAWLARLLDLPTPPDGLICANELGLIGAVGALRARNMHPGRDLKIIVRDSTGLSRRVVSNVGVHFVDMADIGSQLIEALVSAIEDPSAPRLKSLVKATYM